VGTVLPHKGIEDLRKAIRQVNRGEGSHVSLVVTAPPPPDAEPWEDWVGVTTIEDGLRIVRESDVVVLPSRAGGWPEAQLPAKLIDAMLAGRAICVTDVGPMRWAVGTAAKVVEAGDVEAIAGALLSFCDPRVREEFGSRARARAVEHFTLSAVASTFARAVAHASGRWDALRPAAEGAITDA